MFLGNVCITGHNYKSKKNLFGKLRELTEGDTFYLIDMSGRKITYEVKQMISKVSTTDMSHIEQDNDGIRKVTLITCDPGALTRFILKAEEKKRININLSIQIMKEKRKVINKICKIF